MSSHHKHAKPNDSQGSAATDRKDHDTLTVSILVSRDNRPNIQYLKKGRRLCVDGREQGGILEVEGDASHPPILMKPTLRIPLRRKEVPNNRKGGPRPSHHISKATPIFPRALDNREDGSADKTSTQKARPGEQDGSMERPTF
ncbi:hypothetical protein CR513_27094, partial [Mucuna pruriens]